MPITKEQVQAFHCPRWEELPNLPLYMDQVLLVLEGALGMFMEGQERALTPAMINNYVKQKLIHPPEKKKYSREHMALLLVVTVLKRVLSMSEITAMMNALVDSYGMQAAYDMFCTHLERHLARAFLAGEGEHAGAAAPPLLEAACMALTGKLLVQAYIAAEAE